LKRNNSTAEGHNNTLSTNNNTKNGFFSLQFNNTFRRSFQSSEKLSMFPSKDDGQTDYTLSNRDTLHRKTNTMFGGSQTQFGSTHYSSHSVI